MTETVEDTVIALGLDTEKFLESTAGQYLLGLMDQDIEAAKEKFLTLDPYAHTSLIELQTAIAGLQARARQAITLKDYLAETITNGRHAAMPAAAPEDDLTDEDRELGGTTTHHMSA